MKKIPCIVLLAVTCGGFFSCTSPVTRFQKIAPEKSGIKFTNTITETAEQNVLLYEYYYNGNGVAVGDLNNDDLPDLFFTGNQTPSALYLNKGNLVFKDVTASAGVAGKKAWRTGANIADVNGDGLPDIYVCYSGFGADEDRANQLFINKGNNQQGIPVFDERAVTFGLDAPGTYSSQSAFLDYDLDGDLDMFLLNHARGFYSPFYNTTHLRNLRHPQFGNRLYKNNNGHFVDVSDTAGIYGSGINFGLGIAISDINQDGWPDILVSNDFNEQDFLYLNNGNGTFKEVAKKSFAHMSRSTMGLDVADYNNDLLPDVITTDMLPEDNYRQKILKGGDEYDQQKLMVDSGYGHQYSRNMLQLNRGYTNDSLPVFSEIGQLAGVSNTDWSWSALFADFDNDGWKDLFISNGFLRDYTNLDFVKYEVAGAYAEAAKKGLDVSTRELYEKNIPLFDLVKKMPSSKLGNYIFSNNHNLTFTNKSSLWGMDEPGVSSGAAYADLDNDGDLDMIVCNNNDPVWLYKNNTNTLDSHNYIKIKLQGAGKNPFGIGAKVVVISDSSTQLQEMYPVRGYQSSVDYRLNFGLGNKQKVKQVKVYWSGGGCTTVNASAINSTITISMAGSTAETFKPYNTPPFFTDESDQAGINFTQKENEYIDFKREFLIPFALSKQGPKMCKADVNGDGLDDVFIGAPQGQAAALYLQQSNGNFKLSDGQPWQKNTLVESVGAVFFDADKDGDADLYVVSGGNDFLSPGPGLQDQLYLNDGKGRFTNSTNSLPPEVYSGSCVAANDFDRDGDMDLFVGDRTVPGSYPLTGGNILLRNDFDPITRAVKFTNITAPVAGVALFNAGMVTDAVWADVDKDGWTDLVVAGDWMPVKIFRNVKGQKFIDITLQAGLDTTNGWWTKILPADVDNDGDIDFVIGNMGTNTQYKCSVSEPLTTYAADFNNDGTIDPVMTRFIQGRAYPAHSRDELVEQIPSLNKKFLKYADFGNATITDVFSKEQVEASQKFYVYQTASTVFINQNGKFTGHALPLEAQFSCVNGITFFDYDRDGKKDLLLSGNFYPFRVQQGNSDAGMGLLLKGDDKGNFKTITQHANGLLIQGDARDQVMVNGIKGYRVIISKNNGKVQVLKSAR